MFTIECKPTGLSCSFMFYDHKDKDIFNRQELKLQPLSDNKEIRIKIRYHIFPLKLTVLKIIINSANGRTISNNSNER